MVRQSIKDIDVKKLKMAKEVLAVLEVIGITESDLDNLIALRAYRTDKETFNVRIKELEEYKERQIKEDQLTSEKGVTNRYSESIKHAFKTNVEDYNLNGRK